MQKPLHVVYPKKYRQKLRWVAQEHYRGISKKYPNFDDLLKSGENASVHVDFRYEHPDGSYLLGITLFTPGSLKNYKDNKFLKKGKMEGEPKASRIPLSWLKVDDVWFEPGSVGATSKAWGYMRIVARGYLYLGTSKDVFLEFFLYGSKKVSGRFIGRSLKIGERQTWLFWFPEDQTPYVKTDDGRKWYEKNLKGKVPYEWLCGQVDLKKVISQMVEKRCRS